MKLFNLFFFVFLKLTNGRIIGGQRDSHGCLTSAGYIHCNYTDTCIRAHEPCSFKIKESHGIVKTTRKLLGMNVYEIEI